MLYRLSFRFLTILVASFTFIFLFISHNTIPQRYLDFRTLQYLQQEPLNAHNETKQVAIVDETHNCDRCLVSPEWCAEFGSRNMDLTVAYEGTGDRLRRALAKSVRGEPIKFGIIGGSLSRGHGCHCTTFHRQIFDWWNETYPHPDNLYHDGSVGARGSNYFKFCHVEHLRPDLDVVVVELSINDRLDIKDLENVESILRSVLSYPSQPAVIMTASFSLIGKIQMGVDAHLPVAQYYDVPVINMRNSLLPIINSNPEALKTYFAWDHPQASRVDILHFSKIGHTAMAKSTIALIQRQACILNRGRPHKPSDESLYPSGQDFALSVPRQRLTDNFNSSLDVVSPIDTPTCMSIDSPIHRLTPLELPTSHGWDMWTLPRTTKRYYRATEVGARISFEVNLTSGLVAIYHLKSHTMGLGHAKCWFDDDEKHAKELDAWWARPENIGEFTYISDKPISRGKHIVHCQTLAKKRDQEGRGTTFLLIAVMTV